MPDAKGVPQKSSEGHVAAGRDREEGGKKEKLSVYRPGNHVFLHSKPAF